jgi:hypothetical protein
MSKTFWHFGNIRQLAAMLAMVLVLAAVAMRMSRPSVRPTVLWTEVRTRIAHIPWDFNYSHGICAIAADRGENKRHIAYAMTLNFKLIGCKITSLAGRFEMQNPAFILIICLSLAGYGNRQDDYGKHQDVLQSSHVSMLHTRRVSPTPSSRIMLKCLCTAPELRAHNMQVLRCLAWERSRSRAGCRQSSTGNARWIKSSTPSLSCHWVMLVTTMNAGI